VERRSIVEALEKTAGNQSQAAKLLGMTRRALIYRIEQYGLARPRRRDP
jgi:two-component system response regulator AtoC